jgi:hypothetical protein
MKLAQVLVFDRQSNLGAMIRWATGLPYTHAALYEGAKWAEEPWTIEAHDLEGVRHCRVADYFADPTVLTIAVYDDPTLTDAERNSIVDFAEAMNGKPYDVDQLIGILLREKLPWMSLGQNRLDSPDELICSELCGRAYLGGAGRINVLPPGVGVGCLAPGHLTQTLTWITEWYRGGPERDWITAHSKEEVPRETTHSVVPIAPDPPGTR